MEAIEIRQVAEGEEQGGCSLQFIRAIYEIGSSNDYELSRCKNFDTLCQGKGTKGPFMGRYITASLCSVAHKDSGYSAPYYDKVVSFLNSKGWKLLGKFPGAHGNYKMELWGSPSFTLPEEKQ